MISVNVATSAPRLTIIFRLLSDPDADLQTSAVSAVQSVAIVPVCFTRLFELKLLTPKFPPNIVKLHNSFSNVFVDIAVDSVAKW